EETPSPEVLAPERRVATRYDAEQVASCRVVVGMDVTPVYIKNVSRRGVGLVTLRRFEPGTVLVLELDATVPHSVSLFAKVVRLAAQGKQWVVGCALLSEMSDEDLEACRSVKARQSSQERRAGVRVPDSLVAVCRLASVGAFGQWAAEVRNLSPEGM